MSAPLWLLLLAHGREIHNRLSAADEKDDEIRFDMFDIHIAMPSRLIASISKEDCSGPWSLARVVTTG